MPGYNIPDVVVVGGGAAGAAVASECVVAGLGVVVLEAGGWIDPAVVATGLEWEVAGGVDSLLRWGPADRTRAPWPRTLDGLADAPSVAGAGGTTLAWRRVAARAHPAAVALSWPIPYGELVRGYERAEATLGVRVADPVPPKDRIFVDACASLGIAHVPSPDVTEPGWRLQPLATRSPAAVLAAIAPRANCEIRTGCFATSLLVDEHRGAWRIRGVRYRDERGKIFEQDATTVVLCAGAIETPRLWLASGLPATPFVGAPPNVQWAEHVAGIVEADVAPSPGEPVSAARVDLPGDGTIETVGAGPLALAWNAYGGGRGRPAIPPFASRGLVVGSELKRRMELYRHTLVLRCSPAEDAAEGGVALDPASSDEHGAAPSVRYSPAEATVERRDRLARRAAEILLAAGAHPASIHRADSPPDAAHATGTMRIGRDPSDSVADDGGESHAVDGVFVADASALPGGLGGVAPALTVAAFATRVAATLAARHFGARSGR